MATSEANPSEVGMDDLKLDPGTVEPGTGRRVAWDNIQSDRMRQQKPSSTIPLSVGLHKSTRNPTNNLQNSALTTSKPLSRLQNPPGILSSQPCISHQNPLNKPLIPANSMGSLQCMPSIIRSSNNLQSLSVIPVSRPCSGSLPDPLTNNCSRMSSSVQGILSNVITHTSSHQNVFENPTSRVHSGSCQNPVTDSLSSVKNLSSDIFRLSSGPENLTTSSANKLCSSSLRSPSLGSPCRMPSTVQIASSSVKGQSSSLQNLSFNPYSRSYSGRLQNSAIDIGSIPSFLEDEFHKTVSKPCRNSSAITATKSPVCYHNTLDNPVIKPSNPQHSSTSKPFKSMCQSRLVFPFNITVSSFQNSTPRISKPPSSFQNSIPNVDKLYNDLQNPIPQNSKPCHSHPDLARRISKPTNSLQRPSPYSEMPSKNLYKSTSNSDILSNCLHNPASGIDKQSDCIQNLPPDNARPTNSLQNLVPYNKKPCDSLQNPSHDTVKPCNRLQNSVLNNDKPLYRLQNSTSNIKPSCSHQNPLPISIRFSSDGNPTQNIGKLSNSFQNPATSTGRPPSNLHNTTPPSSLHNPTPPSDDSSNSPQNLSSDTPSQPKHVCGVCRVVFDTDVQCIQHIKTKHMQNRDLPWHCSVLPLKTMKNQPLTHTLGTGQPVTVRFSDSGQGRMGTESGQNVHAQSTPLLKTVMTKTLEQPPASAQQTNTVTQSMFRPAVKGIILGTREQFPVSMQKTMIQNMSERSAENKSETRHILETKRVAQNTSSRVAVNSLQSRDAQQTNTVSGCMPGGQTENNVYSRVVQETEMVIQSVSTKPSENSTQTSQQQFETCTRPGFKRRQNPESVVDNEWEVSTSPQKQNPDDVNNSKLEIIISPKQKTKKAESVTCQFCPEQFCDDLKYFEHLQLIHDKMDWYSCTSCQQFFTDVDGHLRVDRKLHQIQKVNNLCVQCNQSFSNTNAFRAHVKLHSKNEALKCDKCNMMFTHACTFAVHQKSHKLGKNHMCDICGKSFRLAKYLSFHLRNHTGERPFPCDLCEKSFSNSSNLAAHRRTHTGEKPYVCNVCQQAFTTSSGLTVHKWQHTDSKPYECEECHKTFTSSTTFKRHQIFHTRRKDFQCHICGKMFSQPSSLNIHTRLHTGERPFFCTVCKARFTQSAHLKVHMRSHTGEKPFVCEICHKAFSRSEYLHKHCRQNHGSSYVSDSPSEQEVDQSTSTMSD